MPFSLVNNDDSRILPFICDFHYRILTQQNVQDFSLHIYPFNHKIISCCCWRHFEQLVSLFLASRFSYSCDSLKSGKKNNEEAFRINKFQQLSLQPVDGCENMHVWATKDPMTHGFIPTLASQLRCNASKTYSRQHLIGLKYVQCNMSH